MTMPAGRYVICDLCYVMHNEWDEVCSLIIKHKNGVYECLDGEFNLSDGRKFALFSTAYGDGLYYANIDGEFPVDAGLIGCILYEDITEDFDPSLGVIVDFDKPFECSGGRSDRNWDGIIRFGHVEIYTGDEDFDDYYEDDED